MNFRGPLIRRNKYFLLTFYYDINFTICYKRNYYNLRQLREWNRQLIFVNLSLLPLSVLYVQQNRQLHSEN